MQNIDFYQIHLDRVSRSFAFCIRKLDLPFRQWVSLSYLLCRALDTIEDTVWDDLRSRDVQFSEFEKFIEVLPSRPAVNQWCARFPAAVNQGERKLLEDAYLLFEDLHELPGQVR